jgi:acyl-CoA hydrolase
MAPKSKKVSSKSQKGKSVRESQVEMTEIVLPGHTNQLGTIFGGQLMAWIDVAAAIAAGRHARTVCVTASIDALHFVAPVRLGHFVCIFASVNFTGNTSMEIGVRLESEDPRTGERTHVATSYLTFVALDHNGRPMTVAPVIPETEKERRRYHDAQLRRQSRLRLREQLEKKQQSE